jgi:uncharacterized membrane protein YdbT with pleckstrin-like domain
LSQSYVPPLEIIVGSQAFQLSQERKLGYRGDMKTSELLITERRVIVKVGWLRRRTLEMFIPKIESVAVQQGIVGRMYGYGTVIIRGTGGSAEMFPKIAKPFEFRNAIQRVQGAFDAR